MGLETAIKKALNADKYDIYEGVVTAHNKAENSVTVEIDEGVELEDIRLRAASDDKNTGVIVWPKIGSYVVFAQVRGEADYVLLKTTAVEEIIIEVESALTANIPTITIKGKNIKVDADEIILNEGRNAGLVKVKDLTKKLNALEKDLNNIKSAFTAWVPAGSLGDAPALKAATASWAASNINPTAQADIENNKVQH